MSLPTLRTERLLLRPFSPADAPRVQALAGAREVAATTMNVPHPYQAGMAEAWIQTHDAAWDAGKLLPLAMTTEADGVIGCISLALRPEHRHGEVGYWAGVPYWGRGFTTEATAAVLAHAFGALGLHRVIGRCVARNPASGRVLGKVGMVHEGTLREHFCKWDRFEDVECYAILDREWRGLHPPLAGDSGEAGR